MKLPLLFCAIAATLPASDVVSPASPDQIWNQLVVGNHRYTSNHPNHPHQNARTRHALAQAQSPGAVILGCSDSRVSPELIFDQGLGDIFVIRVAGNIPDDHVLGSVEYAVEHLHSRLIVVLGHQRCGAVSAAVSGGGAEGHVASLMEALAPALAAVKGQPGDPVENAIRENVARVAEQLRTSAPILSKLVHEGKIKVVGARYDLDSGLVELIR